MSDYAYLVIIILALVVANYVGVALGWITLAAGIAVVLYFKRADRIRKDDLRALELEAQKRDNDR